MVALANVNTPAVQTINIYPCSYIGGIVCTQTTYGDDGEANTVTQIFNDTSSSYTGTQSMIYTAGTGTSIYTGFPIAQTIITAGNATYQIFSGVPTAFVTTATCNPIYTTPVRGDWSVHVVDPLAAARSLRLKEKAKRKSFHNARGSIKRALKLISNFGMEEDARIFISGSEIEVSHPESIFKFVLSKYNDSLISRTNQPGQSTPYKLQLLTKGNVHIASLCVYMKDTPLLDQVFALAMFVKTGCEEDILRKANYFNLTNDIELREIVAMEYPYLKNKMRLERINETCTFEELEQRQFAGVPTTVSSVSQIIV